jgi:hypothetical protein
MATKKSSKKAVAKTIEINDDDEDRIGRTVRMQPWIWDAIDKDRKREKRSVSTHIEFILERYFEFRNIEDGLLENLFIKGSRKGKGK